MALGSGSYRKMVIMVHGNNTIDNKWYDHYRHKLSADFILRQTPVGFVSSAQLPN